METLLAPIVELYRVLLTPASPFSWFGLPISTLDAVGAVRLCVAMRQIKEFAHAAHAKKIVEAKRAVKGKEKLGEGVNEAEVEVPPAIEERSFVRDAATTLLVVYGGEIVTGASVYVGLQRRSKSKTDMTGYTAPFLGIPPSFMVSGTFPALFTLTQALIERLPSVPTPALTSELPLSFVDAMTRAFLLCSLIPPPVVNHASETVNTSPWTLLLTSLLTANGGFFLANSFSMFAPHGMRLTTPMEMLPYGWTTTDLWAAPLITGLFALLTHAQPFWAEAHAVLAGALGGRVDAGYGSASATDPSGLPVSVGVKPVDAETARAACALILAAMFATRASKNFGGLVHQRGRQPL
jgi:hypothetical protein